MSRQIISRQLAAKKQNGEYGYFDIAKGNKGDKGEKFTYEDFTREQLATLNQIPTGTIFPFAGNGDLPVGFLLCNGASVARETYPELFSVIGTTYGSIDDEHFNLPDLRDKFIEGGETSGVNKDAGLPNINGYVETLTNGHTFLGTEASGEDNPFYPRRETNISIHQATATQYQTSGFNFDASRSNSIYGNSNTVQPPALVIRYIIKAFAGASDTSTSLEITRVANDLNDKLSLTGGILRGDVVFMDDGEYDIKWLKFKSPNGSNVFAMGYQGLNNEVWLAKLTADETAIDKLIGRINMNTNQVWFEETFNTTETLCVGRDGVTPYLRLVKNADNNYIQLMNASDGWIADIVKMNNSGADNGSFFMPKAGGTFSGGVIANNTNRAGYFVRNFWVGNSAGTSQSTGYIWAKRK